jgi:hypothetical protein
MMRESDEIGSELRQALEARGCALSAAEARAFSISLIELIADGLLVADPSAKSAPTCNTGHSLYIEGGDRA